MSLTVSRISKSTFITIVITVVRHVVLIAPQPHVQVVFLSQSFQEIHVSAETNSTSAAPLIHIVQNVM